MEPIAIVGMACRFPGASNLAAYWDLLVRGVEAVREPPEQRPELEPPAWLVEQAPSCRRGGFLDQVDQFEPGFFRISPREAARMDPQQRLLLEVAWEALEDAGQPTAPLSGTSTGVFVGIMNADFARRHAQNLAQLDSQLGPGSSLGIASNRISFLLDLRGPSMSVDTLCSSSLVAIHLACESLRTDESSPLAIAGGANVILDRTMDVFYARAGLLSGDGRCRAFDAKARGIVRGEGVGLLVLKRLSRARADGDRIHALILGSAVNQDGRSNGLTSPSRWSQEDVLRTAYRRAGVAPSRVSYLEAHGTGTLIGDPIETAALGAVMGEGRTADRPCAIGSVKTNLGHLESAAGVASVIKSVLSLSHRTLAPSLHFEAPNPYARLEERGLQVSTHLRPWPESDDGSVVTGVSSFGMGGTNAHVVLAAVDAPPVRVSRPLARVLLVPISAHSVAALDVLQQRYAELVASGELELVDLAHSSGVRRDHYDHRRAILTSPTDATSALEREATMSGRVVPGRTHKLVFVFPDDPEHELASGSELAAEQPVFREAMDRCLAAFRQGDARIPPRAARAFAFQVALANLWRSLGFAPDAAVGVGIGTLAAAHVDGLISLEEAVARMPHGDVAFRFDPDRVATLLGEESTVFLEISARPMLLGELRGVLESASALGVAVPSVVPGRGERASLLRTIGELYCLGVDIDWRRLDAGDGCFVPLGSYPWQRERSWLDLPSAPSADGASATTPSILVPSWERASVVTSAKPAGAGEWLVVGELGATANAVVARLEQAGHHTHVIEGASTDAWKRVITERTLQGVVHFCGADHDSRDASAMISSAGQELASTVRLVQALSRRAGSLPRLWLVTRGAQVVDHEASLASLARSTLWGFGRVVANEIPRLRCSLVDLSPPERLSMRSCAESATGAEDADMLAGELLADGDELEIAFRATDRFVARLGRQPLVAPSARLEVRSDAAYLVTGGLGGLGLAAAQRLVERGARKLVLLGRRGVATEDARVAIAGMIARGASVDVEQADVADRDAVEAVLRRHRVRGVIHAAGLMTPSMIATLDPVEINVMMAAKVHGALHLHELTSSQPLDFFVLYSSVATLLGMPGQAAYAAANAYLDVLAAYRRENGLPATSIAWTVIEDTGMAASAGARAIRQLADRGIASLPIRHATEMLEQLLANPQTPAHVGAVPFDLGPWISFYPHASTSARLAPLADRSSAARGTTRAPAPAKQRATGGSAADVRSRTGPDQLAALEALLCRMVATVMHHQEALEPSRSLLDLGIDSLTALELQTMIEDELQIEVANDRLLRGPTIHELAAELSPSLTRGADASAPRPHANVVSLRDEAQLDPQLVFAQRTELVASAAPPRSVLLTGATGFLGAFVLAELLEQTTATIRCLVRADTAADGLRRLGDVLGRYDLPALTLGARVTCVPGDLARPRFGLSATDYEALAHSVDTIIHSGASVNFVFPYEALKAANVGGTVEVLRLAAAARARLHYVSTIGVFAGGAGPLDRVFEDARPTEPERLALGYMRAKWVAEQLVQQAGERGLPLSIFRPGTIAGHATSGAFNPEDFVCVLIKGCVQLGFAPRVDATVNLAPVDYVSRAMVRVMLGDTPSGHYHLVGARAVGWNDIVQWVRQLGYPLETLPYREWRTLLLERAKQTANALVPLLPLFAAHENTDWLMLPPYDDARTAQALSGTGIACAPIDAALVRRYVERFVVSGFLPRPP